MANMSGWTDAEKAEELEDFSQNEEVLYLEGERIAPNATMRDARDYFLRVAAAYNRDLRQGRAKVSFAAAIDIAARRMVNREGAWER